MKKLLTFISFVALSNMFVYAQSSAWTWQNPLPQGNHLESVYFTDANTGYAVGGAGTILKTINGGTSWTVQASGATNDLYSVYFTDASTGYAVGSGGTILKTINSGANWTAQTSGTTNFLSSVYFTDANTGYVVGDNGTIQKTINGGTNWTEQTTGTSNSFESVYFTDSNTGYVVGYNGTILKTVNGGTNWTKLTSGVSYNYLRSVYFIDSLTGYVVGFEGTILKTVTGGILPVLNVSTNSLTIAALSSSTKTFDITSNIAWTTTSNQSWLTVSSGSGSGNATITLTALANPTTATRTATVTISGTGVTAQTIIVTQDAGTTGINEISENSLLMFPNPVTNELTIPNISNNATISIYDLSGKLLISKKAKSTTERIDVNSLANGVYSIKVTDKKIIKTSKFIKQ